MSSLCATEEATAVKQDVRPDATGETRAEGKRDTDVAQGLQPNCT